MTLAWHRDKGKFAFWKTKITKSIVQNSGMLHPAWDLLRILVDGIGMNVRANLEHTPGRLTCVP